MNENQCFPTVGRVLERPVLEQSNIPLAFRTYPRPAGHLSNVQSSSRFTSQAAAALIEQVDEDTTSWRECQSLAASAAWSSLPQLCELDNPLLHLHFSARRQCVCVCVLIVDFPIPPSPLLNTTLRLHREPASIRICLNAFLPIRCDF